MCTLHRNKPFPDSTSEMCTVNRNRKLSRRYIKICVLCTKTEHSADGTSEMFNVHTNRTHSRWCIRNVYPYSTLAAKKLQQISYSGNQGGGNQRRLSHILKSINNKLTTGKAMIARADKGRITIVMYTNEYTSKVQTFLRENNFHTLQKDPTKRDQRTLQKLLQQSNLVIDKRKIKFLTQKTPGHPH